MVETRCPASVFTMLAEQPGPAGDQRPALHIATAL
jgi:hypothetical protein